MPAGEITRNYEDAGLVVPSARSEEMRDLLRLLDDLATAQGEQRAELQDRLAMFHTAAQTRVQALRDHLAPAEGFARQIREQISLHDN